MITKYESFNNPFSLTEGVKAGLEMKDFSRIFGSSLFESNANNSLLEKSYSVYELGLLYENRKSWFKDDSPIYNIESEDHQILFKNGGIFIITNESFRILNEDLWDDANSAWETVKSTAKSAVDQASSLAADTWNTISDGAKKAWEFSKRITSAAATFVKEDPLTCAAIFLQLMSGVVSFIPLAGQAIGPTMLGIAGALEIYMGSQKMKKAWGKFSNIEISKSAKAIQSFSEGAPMVIAGSVSILLGLNDLISAPKAAVPAVGATSTALHSAANKWSSTFAGEFAHTAEHFIVDVSSKAAGKVGTSLSGPIAQFMGNGGSGLASTAVSILFLKIGKEILGSLFDIVLTGMKTIGEIFSFALSLPTKASNAIQALIKAADSPIAKILISPLQYIIQPVVKFLGKMIDTYIKPLVDSATKYFSTLQAQSKFLRNYADIMKTAAQNQLVKSQVGKTKEKNVQVSKEDVNKIKKLPKTNEGLRIQRFKSFKKV